METKDELVQSLIKVVQKKKQEIAKAEKPNWLTNCSFRFNKESSVSTNIQVVKDVDELVAILAFLLEKGSAYEQAAKQLGVSTEFKWFGYSINEWQTDLKTRIAKIQIATKKAELEDAEKRLDRLISPELRQELELKAIQELLDK